MLVGSQNLQITYGVTLWLIVYYSKFNLVLARPQIFVSSGRNSWTLTSWLWNATSWLSKPVSQSSIANAIRELTLALHTLRVHFALESHSFRKVKFYVRRYCTCILQTFPIFRDRKIMGGQQTMSGQNEIQWLIQLLNKAQKKKFPFGCI